MWLLRNDGGVLSPQNGGIAVPQAERHPVREPVMDMVIAESGSACGH